MRKHGCVPVLVLLVLAGCGGRDGGVSSAGDAGGSIEDGATLPAPEWVALTVGPPGTCEPMTSCGGDVRGTWDLAGGCLEIDVDSSLASCPGAMTTRYEGEGRGRVVFEERFGHRWGEARVEVDIFFPEICARFYSCSMLEASLVTVTGDATCATEASGDCRCTARRRWDFEQMDFYTIERDEIVSSSSGKRWAFCIEGDGLAYEDTSPTAPREPGTYDLVRRE